MATYYNPKIITKNIEFSVDAANPKSWNGPTPLGSPYGYVSGGAAPGDPSFSERIDFSNDNSSPLVKGNLSYRGGNPSYGVRGANNREYAYLGGGNPGTGSTVIDRMDYSNDSVNTVEKGNLTVNRSQHGATGTLSYGYFAGGWGSGSNEKSSVDRVDYSSDTSTAAPKGPLARGRARLGTIGNQSYGYFAGGEWSTNSNRITTVERFDFSNDTSSPADKGPLTTTAVYAGGAGNASYGYFGGGYDDWPSSANERTTVDRIDYSSDTTACAAKGPLIIAKHGRLTTGDINYGYFCGGASPSVKSVERIDYSNDTATAVSKSALYAARYSGAGHGTRFQAIPNSTPLWKDMTGKGHDATVEGATFSGLNGGAWDFDGTNDYISVASSSDFTFGTGDFTFEFWANPDDFGSRGTFYDSRPSGGTTGITIGHESSSGEIRVYMNASSGSDIAVQSTDFETGKWQHIAVTRSSGTVRLYINGISKDSETRTSDLNNTNSVNIGYKTYTSSTYDYFDGKIALFRVYKARGFTASEVLNNFNATRTRFGV